LGATGARKGHYAAALDFKAGYFAVNIGPAKYFAFRARVRKSWLAALRGERAAASLGEEAGDSDDPWVEVTLAWTAMVMGYRNSAAIYTRIVRQAIKKWRQVDGIACLNYLDDTLITAESPERLREVIAIIVADCERLGLPINFEKSVLVPVQRLVWLGWLLDFETGLVHIEDAKAQEILRLIAEARASDVAGLDVSLRALAKILGKLMAASRALQPVRLMTREAFALLRARTKAEWDEAVRWSPGARAELIFWADNLLRWNAAGRQLFPETRPITLTVTGDAGPEGWGARGHTVHWADGEEPGPDRARDAGARSGVGSVGLQGCRFQRSGGTRARVISGDGGVPAPEARHSFDSTARVSPRGCQSALPGRQHGRAPLHQPRWRSVAAAQQHRASYLVAVTQPRG
jgi:hypothetical protein